MRFQKINQVNKKYDLPASRQTTESAKETQKLGEAFARNLFKNSNNKSAVVFALKGNLGGGKTTFLQGFAKELEVKDKILSPTFVIQKRFDINKNNFKNFYHIDCYRINKPEEILELDFKKIILNPENIVAIEWPEKIKKFLPQNTIFIEFDFIDANKRDIIIYE
jgi:tRNA threonylcarbamoyladenosine biosynthesis protein TsaE